MKNKICSRCVYDTTIPDIKFDDKGVCQFCKIHDELDKMYPLDKTSKERLLQIVNKIKKNGKNKKYDCVVGVSGGTDSTYTLYQAIKLGLRPLAVHFDNGWNTEIAVRNIFNITNKLKVDLETVVADWEEFKDLQISFLKASVSDAEIPTDVAIHAVLHDVAAKENIKYILLGHSFRTEGVVPMTWTYMDGKYINSVQKKFGHKKITSFPNITIKSLIYYSIIKGIKVIPILNYFNYSKEKAAKISKNKLDWVSSGGHHHESLYTKFFQSYLLPNKFNIDKRKLGFSARIRSGDMDREEALKILNNETYPLDKTIVKYVSEKLCLDSKEFNKIINKKNKTFKDYPTYYPIIRLFKFPAFLAFKLNLIPKIIYFKFFYN